MDDADEVTNSPSLRCNIPNFPNNVVDSVCGRTSCVINFVGEAFVVVLGLST